MTQLVYIIHIKTDSKKGDTVCEVCCRDKTNIGRPGSDGFCVRGEFSTQLVHIDLLGAKEQFPVASLHKI